MKKKKGIGTLVVFMYKEFGMKPVEFFQQWLPYILLIQQRYVDLYLSKDDKEDIPDSDDMSIEEVKQFFLKAGIPVKEE